MSVSSLEVAVKIMVEGIIRKLMTIFIIEAEEVIPSKSLASCGVDSLVAVELQKMLVLWAGTKVSIFDVIQSLSITVLATTAASKSSHIDPCLVNI